MLTNCEVRGEPIEGEKMTAFAKKVGGRKVQMARFKWFRVAANGVETVISDAEKASYKVARIDRGFRIKVIGYPTDKDSGEEGQPVSATTSQPVAPAAAPEPEDPVPFSKYTEADAPKLTDWKIEMNPQQEYLDPIVTHFSYAGGEEGQTEVRWLQEIDAGDGSAPTWTALLETDDTKMFQPIVDDCNRRIKIMVTPVRDDRVRGPTYQYLIEPLQMPAQLQQEVAQCTVEFRSRGASFLLAHVDPKNTDKVLGRKRLLCDASHLEVHDADRNTVISRTRIEAGYVQVHRAP
ncbi:hypothetical protein T484DRAFT_2437376 [Baffinella frigidus]|nr:hypothetical protein T484DRAFT_2437376 [Cryptophyta sp. CCMP2293]